MTDIDPAFEFLQNALATPPGLRPPAGILRASVERVAIIAGPDCADAWRNALGLQTPPWMIPGGSNARPVAGADYPGNDAGVGARGETQAGLGGLVSQEFGTAPAGGQPSALADAGDHAATGTLHAVGKTPVGATAAPAAAAPTLGSRFRNPAASAAPGFADTGLLTAGSPAAPWRPGDPVPGMDGVPLLSHPGASPYVTAAPPRGIPEDFDAFASIEAARKLTDLNPAEVLHGSALKMIAAGERILAADDGTYSDKALALILRGNKLLEKAAPFFVSKKVEVSGSVKMQPYEERLAEMQRSSDAILKGVQV